MLTTYTTYDEVRAALGVAEEEITDNVLSLPNYELVLSFNLEDIDVELVITAPALGVDATYRTLVPEAYAKSVLEARFFSIVQVYAAYVIARHLLNTLPMFAPQTIKDSKTELARIADPYADTRAGVESFYFLMRSRLIKAFVQLVPTASVPVAASYSFLTAVGLAADPVSGA